MQEQTEKQYAIVELFGHARIAGQISEQTFGGAAFVRIDVPKVSYTATGLAGEERVVIAAHTRSFGASAIYSINWCDQTGAVLAAHSIRHQPIQPYSVQDALRRLPQQSRTQLLEDLDSDEIPY